MFTAYDFSNNKEVILGRTYIENEFGHAFQRYYDQNNSNRQSMGATRGFIDEYLCIDGRPIYVGGSEGNYEENPKCIESTKKLNELYHIGKERALQLLTENNTNNDLYHYTFSGKEEKNEI